ncbi:hypothetical protein [Micromonospora sp. NPDC023814]
MTGVRGRGDACGGSALAHLTEPARRIELRVRPQATAKAKLDG